MYRLILILILISNISLAQVSKQVSKIESIASQKPLVMKHILRDTSNVVKVFLKTDFAEQFIIDTVGINKLSNATITQIDLVYSRYKSSENFNQEKLNTRRLKQLKEWMPRAFTDNKIKWRLIEQTDGIDEPTAAKLFHGFVFWLTRDSIDIGYRSETSYLKEVMKVANKNIPLSCPQQIKELLARKKLPAPPKLSSEKNALREYLKGNLVFPVDKKDSKLNEVLTYQLRINENGSIDTFYLAKASVKMSQYVEATNNVFSDMPTWKPSDTVTGRVKYEYTIHVYYTIQAKKKKFITVSVSAPKMISACKGDNTMPDDIYNIPIFDSTILKAFDRNPEWNKMLIVGDLTGSMSPYSAQLMIWYQLMVSGRENKVKCFAFFNDGDGKPDKAKVIGSTGGIYNARAGTITELETIMFKTMDAGNGGDTQENNIEALITGIKNCSDCKDVIMVSDNLETPRDMSLLKFVTKPVKVILCGTYLGINPAYLDIARQTGGSVHTIENDIVNIGSVREGATVTVGKETFRLTRGKFVKVFH